MQKSFAVLGLILLALSLRAQTTFIVKQIPNNTPSSDTLFMGASLNNWQANHPDFQFQKDHLGQYFLSLNQAITTPFEYKVTRGKWETVETDLYGHFIDNRTYKGATDTVFLEIKTWDDLEVIPAHGWVSLIIKEIPKNTPPDASIYAVGNFNAWHTGDKAYKLEQQQNGTYQVNLPLMQDTLLFKFNRGSWETIEGKKDGRARINRQLVLGKYSDKDLKVQIESWEDLAGNPINFYTFLLLLAAFQGLLLIFAINTLQDNNRAANQVLSILLFILSLALIGRVVTYDREIFNALPRLLLLPDFIYFLYAPIFLMYVTRLLRLPSKENPGIHWWQFAPFLLQITFYFPLLLMSKEGFIAEVVDQELKSFFALFGGLALVYNTIYWFICRYTIQQYEKEYGDNHAFDPNLKFLRVVMWLKMACLAIWFFTYLSGAFDSLLEKDMRFITDKATDWLWVVFSFTTFFLGYYTMRQPEIFKLPAVEDDSLSSGQDEKEKAASMDVTELESIKAKVEQVMRNNQSYHDPSLSLTKLAELAKTNPHSLSKVINEGYQMNFNDFVNSYRIKEFKQLALQEDYQNQTLLAIAFTVGFNSKSAFNRSFKKLEGCTPREFLKGMVRG